MPPPVPASFIPKSKAILRQSLNFRSTAATRTWRGTRDAVSALDSNVTFMASLTTSPRFSTAVMCPSRRCSRFRRVLGTHLEGIATQNAPPTYYIYMETGTTGPVCPHLVAQHMRRADVRITKSPHLQLPQPAYGAETHYQA